ncbi:MAG: hypothetical protein WED00_01035 [Aquisalimonadaceae bacterium]
MTNFSRTRGERAESILAFGFPFSPMKLSPFTRLGVGPGVIEEVLRRVESRIVLVSRSVRYYRNHDRVLPQEHLLACTGAAESADPVSHDEWDALGYMESVVLEMFGRHAYQVRRELKIPGHMVFEDRRRQARNKMAYWLNLIKTRGISGYINSNVPHLTDDLIAYEVCRSLGIPAVFPYRMPIVPGVSCRLYIPAALFDHSRVRDQHGRMVGVNDLPDSVARQPLPEDLALIYEKVVIGGMSLPELSREVLQVRTSQLPAQWVRPVDGKRPGGVGSFVRALLKRDMAGLRGQRTLIRTERRNRADYLLLASTMPPDRPFVYFPLHMQPEASSCPLGGMFSDQLRAVRLIAHVLPEGWTVVVKEHPHQQLALRPVGWYDELLKSPNVQLASVEFSSAELQRESRAVVTLTGAAAWEAWLWRKPALVLGHILFQEAPGIYKVRSREDALRAIAAIAAGRVHSRQDIRDFLGRLAHLSFEGHLDAYIAPCMPLDTLAPEANEREIGRRLANALLCQGQEQEPPSAEQSSASSLLVGAET